MNEENQNIGVNQENQNIVNEPIQNNQVNNYEQKLNDENNKPSKSNNALLIIFMIISLLLAGFIVYDKCLKKEEVKEPVQNVEENKNTEEKKETDPKVYVGAYGAEQDNDFEKLYLREDGSFKLIISNIMACSDANVGTYMVENNVVTLKETVYYGCDACFYKKDLKTYTLTIKDSETLVINYDGKTIELKKNAIEPEDKDSLAYYVANPIDGETPEGWGDPWGDCTNR